MKYNELQRCNKKFRSGNEIKWNAYNKLKCIFLQNERQAGLKKLPEKQFTRSTYVYTFEF